MSHQDRQAVEQLIQDVDAADADPVKEEMISRLINIARAEKDVPPTVEDAAIRRAIHLVLDGTGKGRALREAAEKEIERLLFSHIEDPGRRRYEVSMFEVFVLMGSMIAKMLDRDAKAREVHYGPGSDAEKNQAIGDLLYGGRPSWSPRQRFIEAAKWRAGVDVETMLGEGHSE